jgi:hypothetical protein
MPTVRLDEDVLEILRYIKHYLKKNGLRGATYSDVVRWLFSAAEKEIEDLKEGKLKLVKEIKGVCCVFERR